MTDKATKPTTSRSFLARTASDDGKKRTFSAPSKDASASAALKQRLEVAETKVSKLTQELESSRAGSIVQLDPNRVRHSRYVNRSTLSFSGPDFDELVQSLKTHNGNDIPAKVRPISDVDGYDYEVVYGHRRHQASIVAGTPLNATIHDVTDAQMADLMHLENEREDLSIYEQAVAFRLWLDEGLFPSAAELGRTVGLGRSAMSQRLAIADLPFVIARALKDPRHLALRSWRELTALYSGDHKAELIDAAESMAESDDLQHATKEEVKARYSKLVALSKHRPQNQVEVIKATLPSGTPLFSARKTSRGYQIQLDGSGVGEDVQEAALKALEEFLAAHL